MWGLVKAFENATGRSAGVTWNYPDTRYEGKFFRLVEDVLPVAREVPQAATEQPMPSPQTPNARGKYIQRVIDSLF